ncbi:MAG: hypothetical protein JWM27_4923 [Gemmatimonadetes bacterium]|nr:hypothetical protein [Gemmatimonadota bacterium]
MPATIEAPGSGIRVVVDGAGRRVLLFGRERIELPGMHPGGPVPEARVSEDQDGRRMLLLGREEIPIPVGDAPDDTPAPGALDALAGEAARVELDDRGQAHACFAGQRVPIPSLSLTAQEADSARVLVDDSGRRLLLAGPHRVVLPTAGAGEPAMVITHDDGPAVLVYAGQRVVLHGVSLTRDEAASARVVVDADGRRHLTAGARRILVPFPADPPPTSPVARLGAAPAPPSDPPAAAGDPATLPLGASAVASMSAAVPSSPVASASPTSTPPAAAPSSPPTPDVRAPARRAEAEDRAPRPVASEGFAVEQAEPQLNLRSEELHEIIGAVPHWLVRWGTTLVFATVGMLFAVGWLVRYPDVVTGKVVLTTPEPPVRLVPRVSGEVEHLFVKDEERVRPGQPLVVLRGAARWEDVLALSERLERFERAMGDDAAVRDAVFDPMLSLGDLHPVYAAFLQSLSDARSSRAGTFDAQRVAELERQIRDQEAVRANAVAKQHVLADQLDLARRDRDRARAMAAQKLIAETDLDHAEAEYLQRRAAVQDGQSAVASVEVQISAARSQVLDLRQRVDDQGRNQGLTLRTALATLRGAVARWDQENVLRAPSAGRVSLFRVLGPHQFVDAGTPLLAIVPERGRAVGRVLLASAGAGKVEVGQRVLLRLESFPSREYGAVVGRVARVAQLPLEKRDSDDTQYLIEVAVPAELVTTYGRRLPFRQEMRGDADIVTRNRRLIARFFDQVRGSVDTASH